MATPITHIVLAQKVYSKYFQNLNKDHFYIGTSFPDIRYLNVIEREKTHPVTNTIDEVFSESAFHTGLRFHVLIDKVREDFIVSKGIYKLLPESKYTTSAIKFFEDELLYDHITNWKNVKSSFDIILQEEIDFGIPKQKITFWHKILQEYFSQKPDTNSRRNFIKSLGLPEEAFQEIDFINQEIRNNKHVINIIHEMYEKIDELILPPDPSNTTIFY